VLHRIVGLLEYTSIVSALLWPGPLQCRRARQLRAKALSRRVPPSPRRLSHPTRAGFFSGHQKIILFFSFFAQRVADPLSKSCLGDPPSPFTICFGDYRFLKKPTHWNGAEIDRTAAVRGKSPLPQRCTYRQASKTQVPARSSKRQFAEAGTYPLLPPCSRSPHHFSVDFFKKW